MKVRKATVGYSIVTGVPVLLKRKQEPWKTAEGLVLEPSEMDTTHIINALAKVKDAVVYHNDHDGMNRVASLCEELGKRARRYFEPVPGRCPRHELFDNIEEVTL